MLHDIENGNNHFTQKGNDSDLICITHPVFIRYVFDGIVQSGTPNKIWNSIRRRTLKTN